MVLLPWQNYHILSKVKLCNIAVKNKFSYAYSQEFPYRTNHILECEFYLLENLDCCLIVYQPYRPLLQLIQDIGQDDQLLALAWRVVNDSLRTDVCLLYPPYQIALGEWFLFIDFSSFLCVPRTSVKWAYNEEIISVHCSVSPLKVMYRFQWNLLLGVRTETSNPHNQCFKWISDQTFYLLGTVSCQQMKVLNLLTLFTRLYF